MQVDIVGRKAGRGDVYEAIELEVNYQEEKWGSNEDADRAGQHPMEWFIILAEEFGEVAQALNEWHFRNRFEGMALVRDELIQCAAVAVSWLQVINQWIGKPYADEETEKAVEMMVQDIEADEDRRSEG